MNHLINPRFQGINILFVLTFENENDRTSHSIYFLLEVELKGYVLIKQQLKDMKILEKMLLVKEMIIQLVVC